MQALAELPGDRGEWIGELILELANYADDFASLGLRSVALSRGETTVWRIDLDFGCTPLVAFEIANGSQDPGEVAFWIDEMLYCIDFKVETEPVVFRWN